MVALDVGTQLQLPPLMPVEDSDIILPEQRLSPPIMVPALGKPNTSMVLNLIRVPHPVLM
jgi:hypothetical protein